MFEGGTSETAALATVDSRMKTDFRCVRSSSTASVRVGDEETLEPIDAQAFTKNRLILCEPIEPKQFACWA